MIIFKYKNIKQINKIKYINGLSETPRKFKIQHNAGIKTSSNTSATDFSPDVHSENYCLDLVR